MKLWTDFNNIHHGNRTSTSLRFSPSSEEPTVGEQVELYDGVEEGEGNRCMATVINVRGLKVDLELDWTTWISEEDEEEMRTPQMIIFALYEPSTYSYGLSFRLTKPLPSPVADNRMDRPPPRTLSPHGALR